MPNSISASCTTTACRRTSDESLRRHALNELCFGRLDVMPERLCRPAPGPSERQRPAQPEDRVNIDRTIAIVEAASERIKANDFSAVEALFADQALALDAMFDKHARETTLDDIRFALRSQAQCRGNVQGVDANETSARRKIFAQTK